MAVRPTVIWPDSRLREPTVEVTAFDESLRQLYRDLCDSMYAENGLGMLVAQAALAIEIWLSLTPPREVLAAAAEAELAARRQV